MATTTIIPIHASGRAIAKALNMSVSYVGNVDKTDGGEWVTSYECDPLIADKEFAFAKNQYATITGRNQGKSDVLAYHLRISFKPRETDAATANKIGYDLAMKLTKGQHAFVCCTHTNTKSVHSHIIINSTNLDCNRKFRNFKGSAFAIRKIADHLCLENGLSIIENPSPSRGSYGTWLGDEKQPTNREKLEQIIDKALENCNDYNNFLANLKLAGCEVKRGKYTSVKIPDASRFARLKSLGEDYTEEAILERILGKRLVKQKKKSSQQPTAPRKSSQQEQYDFSIPAPLPLPLPKRRPTLLIDIQVKLQQAHSPGYEHWATIYNLKEFARTLIYLNEKGIGTREELDEKISDAKSGYNGRQDRIKVIEARLSEIKELQRNIGTYSKKKDVYNEWQKLKKYQPTKWEKFRNATHPADDYYEARRSDISLMQAAKNYFNTNGYGKNKKLPAIADLKKEYATLEAEKKKLYNGYRNVREDMIDLQKARQNVEMFLDRPSPQHQLQRNKSYGHSL